MTYLRLLLASTLLLLITAVAAACGATSQAELSARLDDLLGFDLLAPSQYLELEAVDRAERAIASCMRRQGFEYLARRPETPTGPSVFDRSYIETYGYGVTTTYYPAEALPAYLLGSPGNSARGGERNQRYRMELGELERAAYDQALEGAPPGDDGEVRPGCEEQAYALFDRQAIFVDNFGTAYADLLARINADPRIVGAGELAAACLQRQGVGFATPSELTDHLQEELRRLDSMGVANFGQDEFQQLSELQDLEVSYAAAVLRCRGEAGLVGDFYDAIAEEYKASFLEEHRDVLQSVFG